MKIACIRFSLLAIVASPARAELYFGFNGGASPVGAMVFSRPTAADLTVNSSAGWMVQGVAGYRLPGLFRIELQAEYFRNRATGVFRDNVQVAVPCGELPQTPCFLGDVRASVGGPAIFAMGFYDLALAPQLSLQVGGGVGTQRTKMHVDIFGRMNNATAAQRYDIVNASDSVFAARAAVQLAFALTGADLTLGYSFTRTGRPSLPGRGAYVPFNFDVPMSRHAILGGVRLPF